VTRSGPGGGWGVDGLSVRYGGRAALADVGFAVAAGSVAAVVGGDGAGKTSLLRALAGTVRPSAGTVRRPEDRRIGYVSAGPGVWGDLTVEENLEFAGRAYGLGAGRLRSRTAQLLERTDLAEARDRLAGRLSGGMRQKLALAMAVLHEPELLILDEPTTGVDPVSRVELWRLLAAAAAGGAAWPCPPPTSTRPSGRPPCWSSTRAARCSPARPTRSSRPSPGGWSRRPPGPTASRRGAGAPAGGRGRRTGAPIPDTTEVAVDLEDAVVVAQLAREQWQRRAA
jgi:ABC-type Na+ transport system ATPase subunit NatA